MEQSHAFEPFFQRIIGGKVRLSVTIHLFSKSVARILKFFASHQPYGATFGYRKVKKLGHKQIRNTMKYIVMIHFKDDEFDTATATTVDEAKEVLVARYDYITEKSSIMLLRKPKRLKM